MKQTAQITGKTMLYALSVALLPFMVLTSSIMLGYSLRKKQDNK